jgi:hypothetical protein
MKTFRFKKTAKLLFLLGTFYGSVATAGPVNINTEVPGIGEKTLKNNIENIVIDGKLPQN